MRIATSLMARSNVPHRSADLAVVCRGRLTVGAGVVAGRRRRLDRPSAWTRTSAGRAVYLSWIKILACWLVFLLWVHTTDWVSTDCQDLKLDYSRWNPIVFGSFHGWRLCCCG